jgi:peptidoglycan/xylan/chitin deacetylase (PgdA/CDA1 family)
MQNHTPRTGLIGWVLLPLVFLWLAFSYLIGLTEKPSWDQINASPRNQVEGIQDLIGPEIQPSYDWNGGGIVTFWFDDAWMSQYTVAAPLLRKHGIKAAMAVPTELVGFEAYLTWEQLRRLAFEGWDMAAHSRNHNCEPSLFSPEQLIGEVVGSKNDLLSKGMHADHYVVPCGEVTEEMRLLIREHFVSMRTSESKINPVPVLDPYQLGAVSMTPTTTLPEIEGWVEQARSQNGWLILMFHQIDNDGDLYSITPEVLGHIIGIVEQSGLSVVTPSQALNAVRSYDK